MFKRILFVLLTLATQHVYAKESDKLIIQPINDEMYVYTTFKEINGTVYSSNAMYILSDDGAILFDTPWDPEQYQPLVDHIKTVHNQDIIALFVTHAHDDRAGGLEFFNQMGIPSYAYTETNKILKETQQSTAQHELNNGDTFAFKEKEFEASFLGAGHTMDNIVIWFPKEKILYGGCLIKSAESTNLGYIKDGDVNAWANTIIKVQQQYNDAQVVIPGHDQWKLDNHIEHTKTLLEKALKD